MLTDKKIHKFYLTKAGKKRKSLQMEPIETISIRGQQSFELHDQINPIQITSDDDRIVNMLKNTQKFNFTPMGVLFTASVKNDRDEIFVTCRELNHIEPALINSNLVNLLAAINSNKINSWEHMKGKSLWVNVNFDGLKEVKKKIIFVYCSKQLH